MANEMEHYKSRVKILESELPFTHRDLELTKQNAKDTNDRVKVLERDLVLAKKISASAQIPKYDYDDSVSDSYLSQIHVNMKNGSDKFQNKSVNKRRNLPDYSDTSKDIKRLLGMFQYSISYNSTFFKDDKSYLA